MKKIPFTKKQIEDLAEKYPTPFYIYEEAAIREAARKLIGSFSWDKGFKEYFAVKATPNPSIMTILKDEGCGTDCSSLPELLLSERTGITGEDIMFSSNETQYKEYQYAKKIRAIINLKKLPILEPTIPKNPLFPAA